MLRTTITAVEFFVLVGIIGERIAAKGVFDVVSRPLVLKLSNFGVLPYRDDDNDPGNMINYENLIVIERS
jgi:hypothetical protein